MKKTKRILLALFIIGLLLMVILLLVPRTYKVAPFKERAGAKYWELKTGSKIGYQWIASESPTTKSPILYLHGGPGGMITDEIINFFKPLTKEGHDLYFYDQIGSGHSARLDDIKEYSVERHLRDLEEIVSNIPSDKVILYGHSWGSMLATHYLIENSAKVEKLILSGPGPILPINRKLAKIKPPDSLHLQKPKFTNKEGNKKAYNLRSKLIFRWAYIFKKKLASDKEADDFFAYLNTELSRSTTCDGTPQKYSSGGGYFAHIMTVLSFNEVTNQKEKLKEIDTGVLLIKSQCDNQAWGYTNEYLDLLSNTRLEIIPNSGHRLDQKKQKIYVDLILDFLANKAHKKSD